MSFLFQRSDSPYPHPHPTISYIILTKKRVLLASMTKKTHDPVDDQFLNVQKAALFLDVSAHTIRRWAQMNTLKGVKIGTRGDWRFTKHNLLQMIKNGDT